MIGDSQPIINFCLFFARLSLFPYAITNGDNNDVDARMICERATEKGETE